MTTSPPERDARKRAEFDLTRFNDGVASCCSDEKKTLRSERDAAAAKLATAEAQLAELRAEKEQS